MAGLQGCLWSTAAGAANFPEFKSASARQYLLSVIQGVQAEAPPSSSIYFIQAQVLSQIGLKDQAESLALQALALETQRADIHSFLANLYIRQDRLPEAAEALGKAVQIDPQLAGVNRRWGMVLDRLGQRKEAHQAFLAAVRQEPADANARLLLGQHLLDQGQPEEAALHLEKACQLDVELASAFYALSQAQRALGNPEAAQKSLATFQQLKRKEKAALDTDNATYNDEQSMRRLAAEFHTQTAGLYLVQQQWTTAEAHLRQAIQIAPQESKACEMLGSLYRKSGRIAEARALIETLVRSHPDQAAYRANLGTLLLQLKEYPAAIQELNKALELDARQTEALNNLARYYLGVRQELATALSLSRRLVEADPAASNYDLLGWALYANGRIKEAVAACAQAVEKEPNHAIYRERHRRLQQAAGESR